MRVVIHVGVVAESTIILRRCNALACCLSSFELGPSFVGFSSGCLCEVNGDHRMNGRIRDTPPPTHVRVTESHHQTETPCVLIFHGERCTRSKGFFFLFRSSRSTTPSRSRNEMWGEFVELSCWAMILSKRILPSLHRLPCASRGIFLMKF